MSSKRDFLKQFFKDKQMVGAISPSSKSLGRKMLKNIDFEKTDIIIELGPGTGVFTEMILERMKSDTKLFVFELNDSFFNALQEKITDPRAILIHDSAEFLEKHVGENIKVDAIVSSLPLMVFPEKLRHDIVKASYEILKVDGKYVQFQYSTQSKKLLEATYKSVDLNFAVKNIPPAFVYHCIK